MRIRAWPTALHCRRRLALLTAVLLTVPTTVPAATSDTTLTLRLRDATVQEIAWVLFELTQQAYVVDSDVVGKVNVELEGATVSDLERSLAEFGVRFTGPGELRRLSTAPVPDPELKGEGDPASLQFINGDMDDILRLTADITGNEIFAPAGPLGRVSLFASERPIYDQLHAILAACGLVATREGDRIVVRRRDEPRSVVLPLNAGGGLVGHVPYRHGESRGPKTRLAGMEGSLAAELVLWGVASNGGAWTALVRGPDGRRHSARAGYRTYDGVVESVDKDGATCRTEAGATVRWALPPAAAGVAAATDDLGVTLERARALRDRRRFDEGERVLASALEGPLGSEEARRVRAALADLRFDWSRSLSARGELERAVRLLEAALEIDVQDRPWQAAEDLNEIGKAWTALGEPERAVGPHRQALEIGESGAVRTAPQAASCIRAHERTPWVEGDALDGLANAERARGRLSEALELYERAVRVWRKVDDPTGLSAALTGMGLVRHDLGQLDRAARLHREALSLKAQHPVVRAVILNNLGNAQLGLRQLDAAEASFGEALAIYRRLQHRAGEGTVLNNLGACAEARLDRARACASYAEALRASLDGDDRRGQAITKAHIVRLVGQGSAEDESLRACRTALAE